MKHFDTPGELVRTYQHRAKKQFGQHFLVDPNILERIADAADVEPGDNVLEIGPGCGTLTLVMLERGAHVTAVELDRDLAAFLRDNLVEGRELELIEADVLEADLDQVAAAERAPWKCAANLPYNVATEVFFRLAEIAERFDAMALMFQKEVAERFVAGPGEDDYSVLSLMGRLYFDSEIAFSLPGGAFVPPPRVSSAVVRFEPVPGTRIGDEDVRQMFVRVVKNAFQKRRKTLPNAMSGVGFPKDVLKEVIGEVGLDLRIRPERVGFDEFSRIAELLVELDPR